MKRIIAILLTLSLLFSVFTVTTLSAGAQSSDTAATGDDVLTVTLRDAQTNYTQAYAEERQFRVGDCFDVYTYLNIAYIEGLEDKGVGSINFSQTYDAGKLALDAEYEEEGEPTGDIKDYLPIIGDKAILNLRIAGAIYGNASTPSIKNPFWFNENNSVLCRFTYIVTAPGSATINTVIDTLAASDEKLTRIIDRGKILLDGLYLHTSFYDPDGILSHTDLSLNLEDETGAAVDAGYTVNWYEKGSDNVIGTGTKLNGIDPETEYEYEVILNEELRHRYKQPGRMAAEFDTENPVITLRLEKYDTLTVSGKVIDGENNPIGGAKITLRQIFSENDQYSFSVDADANGSFTAEIVKVPTSVIVSANGCYNRSLPVTDGSSAEDVDLGDITLDKLPENKITMSLTTAGAALPGEEKIISPITSANGLRFSLYNQTKNKAISGFTVQYPTIFLDEDEVSGNDTIRIEISDDNHTLASAQQTVKLDAQKTGSCSMELTENGKYKVPIIGGNENNTVMLFDGDGAFVSSASVSSGYISDPLPQGSYKAVFIKKTDLLRSVPSIAKLREYGLTANTDYILKDISIAPGVITDVGSVKVPVLNESKLYYTVSENTFFTASSISPLVGKYVVMRCAYEIDKKYSSADEKVTIELPDNVTFINGSLTIDGVKVTYTSSAHSLTVPVKKSSGVVRFYVVPTDKGETNCDASLSFTLGDSTVNQPIGTATFTATAGSINVPEKTGRSKATVSGVTMANSTVTVYDNGTEVGTTESNKAGSWNLTFDLVKPYSFSYHDIYATITNSGIENIISTDRKTLVFDKQYREISKVTMINTAHPAGTLNTCEFRTVFDYLNGSTAVPSYNYWPNYPLFTFTVEFTGGDDTSISNVRVTTANSAGDITTVPCTYDRSTGLWIGTHKYTSFSNAPVYVGAYYDEVSTDVSISKENGFEMMRDGIFDSHSDKEVDILDPDNNEYSIGGEKVKLGYTDEYLASFEPDDTYEAVTLDNDQFWCKTSTDDNKTMMTLVMPVSLAKEYATAMEDEEIDSLIADKTTGYIKLVLETEATDSAKSIAATGLQHGWIDDHLHDPPIDQRTSQNWSDVLHERQRLLNLEECIPEDIAEDIYRRLNNLAQQYFDVTQSMGILNTAFEWLGHVRNPNAKLASASGRMFLRFTGLAFEVGFYSGMAGIARQISNLKQLTCPDKPDEPDRPTRPIADPSGYVYEAVPSNRVEGVKAEAYYYDYALDEFGVPEENKSDIFWDAENYDQVNPLYTDANGQYAWDVPLGQWLVKFSKDGYFDAESSSLPIADEDGYLPVPPPQTEVNIGLVSRSAPTVKDADIYQDEIRISFSQYMQLDSVNSNTVIVKLDGQTVAGEITPANAEYDYEQENRYASEFIFTPSSAMSGNVSVTVRGAKNYAGTAMTKSFSKTENAAPAPGDLAVQETISIQHNSGALLSVDVTPAEAGAGLTLSVATSSPSIVGIANEKIVTDENGHANIMLTGNLPGQSEITVSLNGTGLVKTVTATVGDVETVIDRCEKVTANITSGKTVDAGTQLELSTETEGADIYYTTDGTCPCTLDSPSRIKYTGPITITEDTFIIAYAVKDGMIESYTAGFNYFVPVYLLGDVDHDNKISAMDVTYILRKQTDMPLPFTFVDKTANIDGDSNITIMDASLIQRWLGKLSSNDNIGKPIQ